MARPTVPIKVTYLLASLFAYLLIDAKYFDPDKFKLSGLLSRVHTQVKRDATQDNARRRAAPCIVLRALSCVLETC